MSADDLSFPERLSDAGDRPRVVESTHLGGLLLAFPLAGYGLFALVTPPRSGFNIAEWAVLAALFAGAAGGIAFELRWRKRRAVLVAGSDGVGVYREGLLAGAVTRRDLRACEAPSIRSIRALALCAFVSFAFLWYGIAGEGGLIAKIGSASPGIYLALLTLWMTRGAWFCRRLRLPGYRSPSLFSTAALEGAGIWSSEVS